MSREGRAAHAFNKNRHAQRGFGVEKPKMAPADSGNLWVGEFVASAQGLKGEFSFNSIIALQLGPEPQRMERLRVLSRLGILRMRALWDGDHFLGFSWYLTAAGDLGPRL